ncbi:MAG: hypothetical protein GOMPHAMPRED_002026 [Gomphillus americanus]|uniref:non-specific serine/threonine protein kinase n=1 Tax=Gomphillus americanus TaxID=1940652 RepID=A0A8H3F942_9LECA|nr:MAG: hypothetical protein GOMPHAMPRED_002026 [Gomphillus americanus]
MESLSVSINTTDTYAPKIDLKHITDHKGHLKLESLRTLPTGKDCAADLAFLRVVRFVASGSFGSCFECKGSSGRSYAAKIVAVPQDWLPKYDAFKISQHEINVCTGPRFLHLPRGSPFVRMLGYGILPPDLGPKLGLNIGKTLIYEWCNARDLDGAIEGIVEAKYFLPEGLIWKWLIEVINISHHMSKVCIIRGKVYPVILHDDISMSNMFLTYPEDDPIGTKSWPSIRLGDYGFVKTLHEFDQEIVSDTTIALYTAPSWPRKSVKSELWSLVHIIYLMCTHLCPARPRDNPSANRDGNPLNNMFTYSSEMLFKYNPGVVVWSIPPQYSADLQKFFEFVLVEDRRLQRTPLEAANRLADLKAPARAAHFEPTPAGIFMDYAQRWGL